MSVETKDTIALQLAAYRELLAEKDQLNAAFADLEQRISERKAAIASAMEAAGQIEDGDKISAAGVTVTMRHKLRARYSPERWHEIVEWAVRTGNDHIVQRRLTDAKVIELAENGVEFPEGLSLEPYRDIDFRRV